MPSFFGKDSETVYDEEIRKGIELNCKQHIVLKRTKAATLSVEQQLQSLFSKQIPMALFPNA